MNDHEPLTIEEAEACIAGLKKFKDTHLYNWYDRKGNP